MDERRICHSRWDICRDDMQICLSGVKKKRGFSKICPGTPSRLVRRRECGVEGLIFQDEVRHRQRKGFLGTVRKLRQRLTNFESRSNTRWVGGDVLEMAAHRSVWCVHVIGLTRHPAPCRIERASFYRRGECVRDGACGHASGGPSKGPMFVPFDLQPKLERAWPDLDAELKALKTRLSVATDAELASHGLLAAQLDFKLAVIDRLLSRFLTAPVLKWLRRLLRAIDILVDSICRRRHRGDDQGDQESVGRSLGEA